MPNDPGLVHKVDRREFNGRGAFVWYCTCGEKLAGSNLGMVQDKWARHHNAARETDYLAAQQIAEEEDAMEFPTVRANRGHKRID